MSRSLLIRCASSRVLSNTSLAVFNLSLPSAVSCRSRSGARNQSASRGNVLGGEERCDGRTLADSRIAAWNRLNFRLCRLPPGIDPPEGILQAGLWLEGR